MWILFLVSLFVVGCSSAPRHVIMAPDVFYVGVPQKIHVALFDVTSPHDVEVTLRLPSSSKVISSDHALISSDSPKLLTVKINPEYILNRGEQKYEHVHLFARCRGPQLRFNSNAKVRLSYQDGVLLIHTDKPIYTPKETVLLHIIPLGIDLKPNTKKVKIIVKNPQGTTVQQWQDLVTKSGFIHKSIFLGRPAMTGNWIVDAFYGHLFAHKVSVKFEVQEYILPTFSVKIKGPRYILPTDTYFNVSGKAKYSYGKIVAGKVAVRLSILGLHPEPLLVMTYRSLFYGSSFAFSVQTKHIKNLLNDQWFPEGRRLQIQADVTEKSTGKTEVVESSVYFVTTPYRIEYVNTARYFKPGLPFQIKARVSYPNKENAVGIPVKLTVKAHGTSVISIGGRAITNNDGVITFTLNVQRQARRLNIKVETVSQNVKEGQDASKNFTAFASESTEAMHLRHITPAKVGSKTFCQVFMMSFNVNQMIYLVVSRGQIVHSAILKKSFGIITTFFFNVTSSMSPSAHLVAYYVSPRTGKIVSDSILLEIVAELPNPIIMVPSNRQEINLPMKSYDLEILGTIGTNVTLVGVDQSVYFQSKGNILSPETVFKQLKDSYVDVASGGRNVRDVFKNARMVVISSDMTVNAATRTNEDHRRSTRSLGFGDFLEVAGPSNLLSDKVIIRQYFPKTWIFSEITISQNERGEKCREILNQELLQQCGSAVLPVSLPDTMTTNMGCTGDWSVQYSWFWYR